ncbi:MAG: hypothetical protein RL398_222, partial [Planctomycetota bacterium]
MPREEGVWVTEMAAIQDYDQPCASR